MSGGDARTKGQDRIESATSKLYCSTKIRERSLGEGQMSERVVAFDKPHIQHVIAIEDEPAEEWRTFEELWQPVHIITPHSMIGNLFDIHPERVRFLRLKRLTRKLKSSKHADMKRISIDNWRTLSHRIHCLDVDADLLSPPSRRTQ